MTVSLGVLANMRNAVLAAIALLGVMALAASATEQVQLETPRLVERDQRKEFNFLEGQGFRFRFADFGVKVDNKAALQLQVDKSANPFLSTLPAPGAAQFLTVLKPCGIILPHAHQRATEFYSILSGVMSAGIAQENGAQQNITFTVKPGEVFVAPQGLLHFNLNRECHANAFFQTFNSADPGALNVIGGLAALGGAGDIGKAAIAASSAQGIVVNKDLGAFGLDKECLKHCHLPETGAEGDGLDTLPANIREMFGI